MLDIPYDEYLRNFSRLKECIICGKTMIPNLGGNKLTCSKQCSNKYNKNRFKTYFEANRKKFLEKDKRFREKNPGKYRTRLASRYLERAYGITLEQYITLKIEQDHKCAICKKEVIYEGPKAHRKLHVDHNRKTGRVRQLLCLNCNTMLGMAQENIDILKNAIKYLEKWNNL